MVRRHIGASTFSWTWRAGAMEAIAACQRAGFTLFDIITVPGHFWPADMGHSGLADFEAALEDAGCAIDTLNLPALDHNLASCHASIRADAVAAYTELLEAAARIGGRGVVVVPGRVSGLLPPPAGDVAGWLDETIGTLADRAGDLGQSLFLEVHPLTPVPTARQTTDLCERLGRENVLVAHDVANAEFTGEDPREAILAIGSRMGQVHLSDGTRKSWRHDPFGAGTVDFDAVEAALDEIGFDGPSIVEIISPDPIPAFEAASRRFGLKDGA